MKNTNKPKVLLLFNRVPYPLNNGGAIAMFSSVKEYAELNFEVHILSMNTSKHFVQEQVVQSFFTPYAQVELVYVNNNITLVGALRNIFSCHSYMLERFVSKAYDEKLKNILENNCFDIVHVDALSSMLYVETIRKYSKAKIFYRAQNVEAQIWKQSIPSPFNLLKFLYLKIQVLRLEKFEQKAIKLPDAILPISPSDEEIFRKNTNVKVFYLPVRVPVSLLHINRSYSSDLFFIGALDWFPNVEGITWFIKEVWPTLSKEFTTLKIFIAGRKTPERLLRLKLKNFFVMGEVEDAKEFMLTHGIMVAPILSGSGVRIKIIEAMALGKVVIATNVAAEGLGTTDDENILIANSAEQFVEKVRACDEPSFRNRIGENAHRFTLQNFSESKLESVLAQCGYKPN